MLKHDEPSLMHNSLKAFQWYQECGKISHGLGDLSVIKKQNNFFVYKYVRWIQVKKWQLTQEKQSI
jgi:hypothetical protein